MRFLATCTFGLESILRQEIKAIGLWYEEVGDGFVAFSGEEVAMIKSNLWLRTANKVFIELVSFQAESFEELFQGIQTISWLDYITVDTAFPVAVKSYKSQLSSTPACQSIVKKAVVKKLQETYQTELFSESDDPVEIHVWIRNDQVRVLLNTSGNSLHQRGYRESTVAAPLKETLAAGLVYLSKWKCDKPLYDPFCGSGTIAIEAAMIAQNIAPGLYRNFDFEYWAWTNKSIIEQERKAAKLQKVESNLEIYGSDIDAHSIELAKQYAKNAGAGDIQFFQRNMLLNSELRTLKSELEVTSSSALRVESSEFQFVISNSSFVILTNPPYGLRLGAEQEVRKLYRQLGKYYLEWKNVEWNILTAYPDIERDFGKQAKRRKLYNGGIQCYLFSFI